MPSIDVRMWESCERVGRTCQPSSCSDAAAAHDRRAPARAGQLLVGGRHRRVHSRSAAEHRVERGHDEQPERHQRRDRVAGQREDERALVVDGERRRAAGLELDARRRPRGSRAAASAGRTWSCGPTDTPPVVMRMSTSRSAARRTETVASRSSPTRTRATSSPPARCTAPPSAGPLESRIPPGGSGLPGSVSSSPVPSERDARPAHDGRARDVQRREHAELGRAQQRAGVDDELAGEDVLARGTHMQSLADRDPRRRPSCRRRRRSAPAARSPSAPSGTGAPVEMRTALPARTLTPAAVPAFASPMSSSATRPSAVSAARIA